MTAETETRWARRGEIVADGIVHAVGLAAAIAGAGALVTAAIFRGGTVTAVIYVVTLIAMLAASAAHNLGLQLPFREALRRLDHATIFIMIAGTYTPFTAGVLTGGWAIGLTAAVWAIAALGVLLKTAIAPHGLRSLTMLLYIAFGWIGVIAAQPFLIALSPLVIWLLLAGGVIYSVGTIFFAFDRLPYRRAIWHGFVVAGAAVHFCAIFLLVSSTA